MSSAAESDSDRPMALVTGGSGFIGGHLIDQLLEKGWAVRVLDPHPPRQERDPRVTWRRGSVTDANLAAIACAGAQQVFHLAALSQLWVPAPAAYGQVNVWGTRTMLTAAAKAGVDLFVHTSTEVILRGWRDGNSDAVTEDEPLPDESALAGPYSRSKYRAEKAVREAADSGMPVRIVYPTVPVGPGDLNRTPPTRMIAQILTDPPPARLASLFNLVDVASVADGMIRTAEHGTDGGRYLLGGDHWTYDQIAQHLAPLARRPSPRRQIPYALAVGFAHVDSAISRLTRKPPTAPVEGVRLVRHPTRISSAHAAQALGWTPADTGAALTGAAQWLLQNDAGTAR